jgi:hypothetical protein
MVTVMVPGCNVVLSQDNNDLAPMKHALLVREDSPRSSLEEWDVQDAMYGIPIIDLADVYTMGDKFTIEESKPFVHGVKLHGPQGEVVCIKGVLDDGAMINAIDVAVSELVKHRLQMVDVSDKVLQIANGVLVPLDWDGGSLWGVE